MDGKRNILLAYLLALPAIILLFILKVIPLMYGFILPFKDYSIFEGMNNSAWIGLENFSLLFNNNYIIRLLRNTITINVLYIIISLVMAFVLTMSILKIKSLKVQRLFCLIILIPLVIPTSIFAIIYKDFIWDVFKDNIPNIPYRLIIALFNSIKILGIPVTIAIITSNNNSNKVKNTLNTLLVFGLIQITYILTTNFDILHIVSSPIIYEKTDTFSNFMFRNSFMTFDLSTSSVIWLLKYIIEVILTIFIFFIITRKLKKYLFINNNPITLNDSNEDKEDSIIGYIVPTLYSLCIVGFLLYIISKTFIIGNFNFGNIFGQLIIYFIIYIVTSILSVSLSLFLAYPLTIKGTCKKIYSIFLLLLLVGGNAGINLYIYYKSFGLTNTYFVIILSGLFSIISVFAFAGIFNNKYNSIVEDNLKSGKREEHILGIYFKNMLKPAIGIGALHFFMLWGNIYNPLVYISEPQKFSPTLMFYNIIIGSQVESVAVNYYLIALLIIVIPIIVLIGLRKFILSDSLVSRIR